MKDLRIDRDYLVGELLALLAIPSPSGFTDAVVRHVCGRLGELGIDHELTRRGAIRGELRGRESAPDRAIVAHLDTLGAAVRELKANGRLALAPIGHWSSRFAEGARVTVFRDRGEPLRGTILPLLASGHSYGDAIDTQPVSWDQVELRVDCDAAGREDLRALGFQPGDAVAVDPNPEVTASGHIVSRHLDDKAGVAALLAALHALRRDRVPIGIDCHPLFTISEEVGSGASHVLHGEVAEMVAIDNAPPSAVQNATERDVTLAMMDSTGPFDFHLTRRLAGIAAEHGVPIVRDVFRYYRCDAASAIEAGNDIRTALLCFGADASHGYERTHIDGLVHLARLLALYVQSPPAVARDRVDLGPIEGFPEPSPGIPSQPEPNP
jgi:peptidase M42 family hydrolase